MKTWDEVEQDAALFLAFLKRPVFFDGPYTGPREGKKIIFDADLAAEYSNDDSGDKYTDWQSLLESVTPVWPDILPDWQTRKLEKKMMRCCDEPLRKDKDLSGIELAPLIYNMQGDIIRLLHSYVFGQVHPLWKQVEQAYLDGGILCGWEGNYPEGEPAIFSNRPIP